ncbi:MAG: uracil-DNA glycosylase [Sphingomonas sp.]|uniref:uracil-DNA glycosylase n=1 Tax=Sphingomonas sp. TaxID=28214 RepID=UPI0018339D81|nr:uracil-DNA glycosylase [Sphingomonas sp.]MBA3668188.1 uracil-DNA glycosylase [Sphingomonas sp.]
MGGDGQIIDAVDRRAADGLIDWWREAGVEVAVGEQPRGWLRGDAPAAPPSVVASAVESPADLIAFQSWIATAPGLPMDGGGAVRVAPRGMEGALVMLLADLPGADDVAEGQPIGGEAWALTVRMLAAIGIAPDAAYHASLACFHAPGARIGRDQLEACAAIARDHIRLARPERLILFGDAPARALLGEPLARARGRLHKVEGVRTIATFHPRWLLQRPSDKALAWRDLLLLMSENN